MINDACDKSDAVELTSLDDADNFTTPKPGMNDTLTTTSLAMVEESMNVSHKTSDDKALNLSVCTSGAGVALTLGMLVCET